MNFMPLPYVGGRRPPNRIRFKSKGMDVGVSDEYLNGVPVEHSSSEGDEDDADSVLRRSYKHSAAREQTAPLCDMNEMVGRFENVNQDNAERRRERKQEIQSIRSRLFMVGGDTFTVLILANRIRLWRVTAISAPPLVQKSKPRCGRKPRISSEHHMWRPEYNCDGCTDSAAIYRCCIQTAHMSGIHYNRGGVAMHFAYFMYERYLPSGKQAKIKEMYEQSVAQSEQSITSAEKRAHELEQLEREAERARALKQRFETGEIYNGDKTPNRPRDLDDRTLFDEGIGKKSRSIFLELDANAKNAQPVSPPPQEVPRRKEIPFVPKDVVRAADKTEEIRVETRDISDRFKFFETYRPEHKRKEFRMTPPREPQRKSPSPEVYHEPSVVRNEPHTGADASLAAQRHTASRMISVFRQMEEELQKPEEPQGPKPLKRFTPPPPGETRAMSDGSSSEEEYSDDDSEEERRRYIEARQRDEALKQAQQLARTKSFRGRFESNNSENERPPAPPAPVTLELERRDDDGESQVETARRLLFPFNWDTFLHPFIVKIESLGLLSTAVSNTDDDDDDEDLVSTRAHQSPETDLREKFENMKVQQANVVKTCMPKVNRFVPPAERVTTLQSTTSRVALARGWAPNSLRPHKLLDGSVNAVTHSNYHDYL
ncbi:hypothetical protein EVAR_23454_1 [Eumeta japonica]|uniref:Uncharacterized protein n=1 Tax=Eumeta variegata TaxID=151549 RepID=A0A4C1ULD6_EUMVA|nr:hypothetical protein EVAR_23454_1 [Eumeta japonica]